MMSTNDAPGRRLKVGIQLPEVEREVRWAELLDMVLAIEDGRPAAWRTGHLTAPRAADRASGCLRVGGGESVAALLSPAAPGACGRRARQGGTARADLPGTSKLMHYQPKALPDHLRDRRGLSQLGCPRCVGVSPLTTATAARVPCVYAGNSEHLCDSLLTDCG
jgi:hypothetical protein